MREKLKAETCNRAFLSELSLELHLCQSLHSLPPQQQHYQFYKCIPILDCFLLLLDYLNTKHMQMNSINMRLNMRWLLFNNVCVL